MCSALLRNVHSGDADWPAAARRIRLRIASGDPFAVDL
jgi:hypothetical protein